MAANSAALNTSQQNIAAVAAFARSECLLAVNKDLLGCHDCSCYTTTKHNPTSIRNDACPVLKTCTTTQHNPASIQDRHVQHEEAKSRQHPKRGTSNTMTTTNYHYSTTTATTTTATTTTLLLLLLITSTTSTTSTTTTLLLLLLLLKLL